MKQNPSSAFDEGDRAAAGSGGSGTSGWATGTARN